MPLPLHDEPSPIYADPDGVVRLAGSRVPLVTVVNAFAAGATPEQIALQYPTVALTTAYAAVAYYLRHRTEVDAYLTEQTCRSDGARAELERQGGRIDVRELLLRRRKAAAG